MKNVLNIVITGGPCGGKTTALDELTKFLRSYGFEVILVGESATEFKNSGIKPYGDNAIDLELFQELLLDYQLIKEKVARKAAYNCKKEKVAILYDRAVLDNRAYITDEIFERFLKERNISESDIIASYDIVIHMVTAAFGKEEYYTTVNNTTRFETAEEARIQDLKTRETWKRHPNLNIIGNDTLFNEKIEKVKNVIRSYFGENEVIRKESYVVGLNDIDYFDIERRAIREDVEEFVLNYDDEETYVYTKSTIQGSSYFTCSKNIYEKNGSYRTICHTISKDEYRENLAKLKGEVVKEIRYNFIDEGERFKLIIYLLHSENIAVLERDVVDENRITLPSCIRRAINVTNNREYRNDSIYVNNNVERIFKKKR